MILESARLIYEKALPENEEHVLFLMSLWGNKEVMTFVGFPEGIRYTQEEMKKVLPQTDIFLARERKTQKLMGQGKAGLPHEGISTTDVKVHPSFWGRCFGSEIKLTMVEQCFLNPLCSIVESSPNILNKASLLMQERCGGRRIREFLYEDQEKNILIKGWIYHIFKEEYQSKRRIIVESYQESWNIQAQKIIEELTPYFKENLISILHGGSTALKGCTAKPTLDIYVLVDHLQSFLKEKVPSFVENRQEAISSQRLLWVLMEKDGLKHKAHIHIFPLHHPEYQKELDFISFLQNQKDLIEEYSEIKSQGASKFPFDIEKYIQYKEPFIKKIYSTLGY